MSWRIFFIFFSAVPAGNCFLGKSASPEASLGLRSKGRAPVLSLENPPSGFVQFPVRMAVFLLSLLVPMISFAGKTSTTSLPAATKSPRSVAPANGVLTQEKPIYTLRLNSNPTTGFSWFMVDYPKKLVHVIKHQYVSPKSKLVGAGGYELWTFQATKAALAFPQVVKIVMMYARPWEINDQSTTQSFYITTAQ